MQQPFGIAMRILEERSLAQAKQALESATTESDVTNTPMVQLVKQFRSELWVERMEEIGEYTVVN